MGWSWIRVFCKILFVYKNYLYIKCLVVFFERNRKLREAENIGMNWWIKMHEFII